MTSYSVTCKLGEGSFAKVFQLSSLDRDEGQDYALKVIDKDRFSNDERDKCMQEAKLMRKLRHENVVACFDAFEYENHLILVTEYCPRAYMYCYLGDCRDAKPQQPVSENRISMWVLQIAKALQYLHERKILHRDLKTKNIFLMEDLTVKIGDLGIAKQLDFTLAQADTFLGTPLYMSPEIFQFQPYSYKADIWSMGCCVYEMMTLRLAFESPSQQKMVQRIIKGKAPTVPAMYSKNLGRLANDMLNKDPQLRPHAVDIVKQLQSNQERPSSGDMKISPRSRRRLSTSRSDSRVGMPDLTPSLRSDRHAIVDSLMTFFRQNTATGLGNGFEIGVLSSTKSALSRTVKTIWTRNPSQEETTQFVRKFGTGLQNGDNPHSDDMVDNIGYGETSGVHDTVKKSPRKRDKTSSQRSMLRDYYQAVEMYDDNYYDIQPDPDDVIQWARQNLASCNVSAEPPSKDSIDEPKSRQPPDAKLKTRKKKNFLKAASEKKKTSTSGKDQSAQSQKPPVKTMPADSSKTVTLFTRSQKVVFRKEEFLAGDADPMERELSKSLGGDTEMVNIGRLCKSDLGDDMFKRAQQLVEIVKDERLLQVQLQDLLGWRNYKKFGAFLISEGRTS
ncbi:serine/threonine-protein kinase 26-like [Haliotis rubra]|uniref:serine/threonine-protein kinase 26-like n=1 Tax=Haliotis rubra TaxID=36100 RepID=UPI001EE5308A|nr:serine/threonine-protein kinase 26-like [Haliotis rubra]